MNKLFAVLFLYLAIGCGSGRIAWEEFRNDIPSQKLSLMGKSERIVLFPVMYYNWGDNLEIRKKNAETDGCEYKDGTKDGSKDECLISFVGDFSQDNYITMRFLQCCFGRFLKL